MTKKDYERIALFLCHYEGNIPKDKLVNELSDLFKFDNPNFDRGKFRKACYPKAESEG